MAFSIKNEEADELLRELVELTGESLTDAVRTSLRERIERERRRRGAARAALSAVAARCAALEVVADVAVSDVLVFDGIGLPR